MTRAQLTRALGDVGLQLDDAQVPYRPPSRPRSSRAAGRRPGVLPDDPTTATSSIYEFPTTSAAADGGRALAGYLRQRPGRIQFPPDAQFRLRQLGTTLDLLLLVAGQLARRPRRPRSQSPGDGRVQGRRPG